MVSSSLARAMAPHIVVTTSSSSSSSIAMAVGNMRKVTSLVFLMVLILILFMHVFDDSSQAPLGIPPCVSPPLSALSLRVCSHSLTASDLGTGAVDGASQTLALFSRANVTCFDVDVVKTADDFLIQAHPSRYLKCCGLAQKDVERLNLQEVRQRGASDTAFPLLETTLKAFANIPASAAPPPFVMLDVKTPGFKSQTLALQTAERLGVLSRTMLYTEADASARARPHLVPEQDVSDEFLRLLAASAGASCAGRDRNSPLAPNVNSGAARREANAMLRWKANDELRRPICDTMSISYKLNSAAVDAFVQSKRMTITWVVDDDDAIARASALGVSALISNIPLQTLRSIVSLPVCSPEATAYWRSRVVT
uniref:Glycerophosphodiester phosphodiesterase n=1 Tax=Pycnococcus provasolii TaxID=41880 RepID=A0A7S2Z018_9CHLO